MVGKDGLHDGLPQSIESFQVVEAHLDRVQEEVESCRAALRRFRDELGEKEKDDWLEGKGF